jgi:hypothetical protein
MQRRTTKMKLTYQKPEIRLMMAIPSSMIAASGPIEDGFAKDTAPETTETEGNLARQRSVWDEEEDEDNL